MDERLSSIKEQFERLAVEAEFQEKDQKNPDRIKIIVHPESGRDNWRMPMNFKFENVSLISMQLRLLYKSSSYKELRRAIMVLDTTLIRRHEIKQVPDKNYFKLYYQSSAVSLLPVPGSPKFVSLEAGQEWMKKNGYSVLGNEIKEVTTVEE